MGYQVEHPPEEVRLGTNKKVHLCLVSYFPPDAVLMGRECQHDKVGGLEVAFCGCGHKDAAAATEVNIFEAEQGDI